MQNPAKNTGVRAGMQSDFGALLQNMRRKLPLKHAEPPLLRARGRQVEDIGPFAELSLCRRCAEITVRGPELKIEAGGCELCGAGGMVRVFAI